MLKKYKQFINESILNYLKGPTEEDVWNKLKDETDETKFFNKLRQLQLTPQLYKLAKDKIHSFLKVFPCGTKLIICSTLGLLSDVKELIQMGGIRNNDYSAALCNASIYGHYDIVKFLLSFKKNINIHYWEDGGLRYAASNGFIKVVQLLIEKGADIHAKNDYALRYAVGKNHLNVVKYLVKHGANIHAENDEALKIAAENGLIDVVKYLKSKM